MRGALPPIALLLGSLVWAGAHGGQSAPVLQDWLSKVSVGIRESEYHFSLREDGAWSAPNRAHDLRSRVTEEGIEITPRVPGPEDWGLTLRWAGVGRGFELEDPGLASLRAEGNRIEVSRDRTGEWLVNDERGLEQGFDVPERPLEDHSRLQPFMLDFLLRGDLGAHPSEDGQEVDFRTARGTSVVRYAHLLVTDASGRALSARFAVTRGHLQIMIEDQDASYPIAVDALTTSPAWTAESDRTSAQLGFAAATAGDVNGDGYSDIVVGAPFYDTGAVEAGRVYVYLGSASGLATTAAWTADGNANDQFGRSVATAGDVNGDGYSDIIVGAPQYSNGQVDEGRACIYLGSGSGLSASPAWTAESNQANADFGYAVATAGDVNGDGYADVIVGAVAYQNGEAGEGRAFVYLGSSGGPGSSPSWTAEGNQEGANFGVSVATAGDVNGDGYSDVIIGAHVYDNGETDEGRAYVYLGSASGLSTTPAWTAESDQAGALFGISVAAAGDVNGDGYSDVIVGAPMYDNGQTDEGRAYVYLGSAAGLATSPAWTAESDQAGAGLGFSVATAGDVNGDGYADVIVGAYTYDNGETDEGRAYVFLGSASGLATTAAWTAESDQAGAQFGHSVATAGDVNGDGYSDVIVGACLYGNGQAHEGRAYVYLGSGSGPAVSAAWTAESDHAHAQFGFSVASAGDVNGDGYGDVIVGARGYDNAGENTGRAFVYLGSASGLATSPAWFAGTNQVGASFGYSVASAGDVNGDGYGDVIVGAQNYENGEVSEGRAFLYLGSPTGLATAAAWTGEADYPGAAFGSSVATAGDVNGDGYSDVIVGAPYYTNGQSSEGRAFVYLGSPTGLATTPTWTAEGDSPSAYFGIAVSTAGDVNGDGYSDIVVGASGYSFAEGRAFVFLGSPAGPSNAPAWTVGNGLGGGEFGTSVASAGDVNGDGYSDVLVGARIYSNGQAQVGRAYLFLGSTSGLATIPAWTVDSSQDGASFGLSVASAGDVNGDGYSDVIIGADHYDNGQTDEGRAFVYLGSASGLATAPTWTAEADQAGALFGCSVAAAGDVDGDGFGDVIVGSRLYSNGQLDEGRTYVYYGNGGGLDRAPRQIRADGTAPIGLLGRSDSEAAFRLRALGRTPAGRGKVRLEWEVKPLGTAFNELGLQRGAASADTGLPLNASGSAVPLEETVTGLAASTVHHWRLRIVSDSPFFPHSRWLSLPYNSPSEADLRTGALSVPSVTSVDPPDNSEDVSMAANVTVTFSEAMNAGTVTGSTFRLLAPGPVVVPANISVSPSGRQATIDPTSALAASTLYTVQVTSGAQDLAGQPLPAFTSVFHTGTAPPPGGTPLPPISDQTTPPPSASQARTGASVSGAGDLNGDGLQDILTGAPAYQVGSNLEAGAALVYLGSAVASERRSADIIFTGESAHDRAGVAVAGRFDFNGDGIPDILIGAEQVDRATDPSHPTPTGNGKVYLIFFDPTDTVHYPNLADPSIADTVSLSLVGQPGGVPGVVFTGEALGDQAGFSVAGGGRVNAGRGQDILIGAPGGDPAGRTDAGRVYLIFDQALSGTVSLSRVANNLGDEVNGIVYRGTDPGGALGFAGAFPGDVAGTVGDDLAMGAPLVDTVENAESLTTTLTDAGIVYVAHGGALSKGIIDVDVLGNTVDGAQFVGDQAGEQLGYSVAGGGDNQVNGEPDLLMGAPGYDATGLAKTMVLNAGAVFQVGGHFRKGIIDVCLVGEQSANGLDGVMWTGAAAGDQLGSAVAGLGDVTGDGYDDIALGAPFADPYGVADAGTLYLIGGGPSPISRRGIISVSTVGTTTAGEQFVGTQTNEQAGSSVAATGDVNGGGTGDFAVGAPNRDVGAETDAGTVYILAFDDVDGDGRVDTFDCDPTNDQVWEVPSEVRDLRISYNRGTGVTTLSWTPPEPLGGTPTSIRYDTIRSGSPTDFVSGAVCVESDDGSDTTSSDTAVPARSSPFYYLVRPENSCGAGVLGSDSGGSPRTGRSCP